MVKVCFVASSGGHLEEISRLWEIEEENDSFLITERTEFPTLDFCSKVYYVPQINRREKGFFFKFIAIFMKSVLIFRKENPDCIISSGALATIPICMVGKWKRKKVIYIESFARLEVPSFTGKLIYKLKLADLFLVQWESMLKFYPKGVYCGGIF